MSSVAIICEYNPFHKGHEALISAVKAKYRGYTVISVMSGNAVQRGELPIYDKYFRAKCAVLGGSDIVAELPFPFSCSAGEQFARAGVYIAHKLGADVLAFGSETGDIEAITAHARNLISSEFDEALGETARANPDVSYILLRERLYKEMFGMPLPGGGNDMLGIEYIKTIISEGYGIIPSVFKRVDGLSATAGRAALKVGDEDETARLVSADYIGEKLHPGLAGLSELILGYYRLNKFDDKSGILGAVSACAKKTADFEEFISMLPTAVYTSARLRRELIGGLLGVDNAMRNEKPTFTTLLAASKTGTEYLKSRRKTSDFPILTKKSDAYGDGRVSSAQLELCEKLDYLYHLAAGDKNVSYFGRPFICDR